MTNSEAAQAHEALETMVRTLHPEKLRLLIDVPLDAAATRLLRQVAQPQDAREFNLVIGDFVRELLAEGSLTKPVLSSSEAFSTAVELLDHRYSPAGQGYCDALVDGLQAASPAMEDILHTLAGAIKERERTHYVRWIHHLWLNPLSWSSRCALVDLIRQNHATTFSPPLFDGPSSRFAGDLDDLVAAHIASIYAPLSCGESAWNGTE